MHSFGKVTTLISGLVMGVCSATAQDAPMLRLGENSPLVPPFCETFDNFRKGMEHDDFPRYFQTIDSNDDNRSWGLYNYQAEPYGRCAYMLFPIETLQADDWLITRAVKLEKGKYYCISLDAALYLDDSGKTPQVFEVKIGTYNDAEGMKTTVIPATTVSTKAFTHVYGWFKPDFTTKYYIGVHGISPTYSDYYNYLFIDNIAVEAPRDGGVPAGVTNLTMTNDKLGSNKVEISFTAPVTALDGSEISSLTAITVARDGEEVAKVSNPVPGKSYTITDTPDEEGTHYYTITASNEAGEGESVPMTHACGIAAPVAPEIISFKDAGNGEVTVSWTAPTEDVNGNAIDPEIVTYTITDYTDGVANQVANDLSETELTYEIYMAEGEQKMALCTVTAEINGKFSEEVGTRVIAVGTPYSLPYHNSFTLDDYEKYVMSIDVVDNVTWRMLDDYSDPDAQDGDNGYVCMIGNQPDQKCTLWSGKIDLTTAARPTLSFYTYVYSEDLNSIKVKAVDCNTEEAIDVETIGLSQFETVGWHKVTCSLNSLAGKVVQIGLEGQISTHGYIPVDNLLIEDMPARDLEILNIDYPRQAEADEVFTIYAQVINNGYQTADNYTVTLTANDRDVQTVTGPALQSRESAWVELTDKFTAISPASTDYSVRVNLKGDEKPENDLSKQFNIVFVAPNLPAINDLTVNDDGQTVKLAWSAPDLSKAAPESVTEGFEAYPAFATEIGGWTMRDLDEGLVAGFQDLDMPIQGTTQAYWVMSATGSFSFIPTFTGTNALVAMYALTERNMAVKSNDWLISPELYGGSQSINFWACSLTEDYGREQFEVWYSTDGNSTTDFKLLTPVTEAPEDWTNYFVALPEGTKYFAIRYCSEDRYMFILDDISFIPSGTPRQLTLKGYNVYNGTERLTPSPIADTSFTTPRTPEGGDFFVTAVYDMGESVGSNIVTVVNVGLDAITTGDDAPAEYYDLRGMKVDPANAAPGIYLRRTGTSTTKVLIK